MSVIPEVDIGNGNHTLYYFIPPKPDRVQDSIYDFLDNKNYFETNPEFFALNERGEPTAHKSQLNFGNPELRAELTRCRQYVEGLCVHEV